MTENLEAIYDELRRLQKEGVGHVFIEDSTQALLKPKEITQLARERGKPVEHTALAELIKQPKDFSPKPKADSVPEPVNELPPAPRLDIPKGTKGTQLKWLREQFLNCATCNEQKLSDEKIVPGNGDSNAEILFCAEAPGTDEAGAGKPFVGNAGLLLDKIIKAMGLNRETVYCTYLLKWRPKNDKPYGNRPPTAEEMSFCLPYFRAELEIIQPKIIVALGNHTVNGLLGSDPNRKMGDIRGTWAIFQDIPVMITFNPAYLLRNDTLKTKRMIWEDLLAVMEKVELPISDKQRSFFLPK